MKTSSEKWSANFWTLLNSLKGSLMVLLGEKGMLELCSSEDLVNGQPSLQFPSSFHFPTLSPAAFDLHCRRVETIFQCLSRFLSCNEDIVVAVPIDQLCSFIKCCLGKTYAEGVSVMEFCPRIVCSSLRFLIDLVDYSKFGSRPFIGQLTTEMLNTLVWINSLDCSRNFSSAVTIIYQALSIMLLRFGPATNLHVTCCRLWELISTRHLVIPKFQMEVVEETQLNRRKQKGSKEKVKAKQSEGPVCEVPLAEEEIFLSCCNFLQVYIDCLGPFVKLGFYTDLQRYSCRLALRCAGNSTGVSPKVRMELLKLLAAFLCGSGQNVTPPLHVTSKLFSLFQGDPDAEVRRLAFHYGATVKGLARPLVPAVHAVADPAFQCHAQPSGYGLQLDSDETEGRVGQQEERGRESVVKEIDDAVTHIINIDDDEDDGGDSGNSWRQLIDNSTEGNSSSASEAGEETVGRQVQAIETNDIVVLNDSQVSRDSGEEPDIICVDDLPAAKKSRLAEERQSEKDPIDESDRDMRDSSQGTLSVDQMLLDFIET